MLPKSRERSSVHAVVNKGIVDGIAHDLAKAIFLEINDQTEERVQRTVADMNQTTDSRCERFFRGTYKLLSAPDRTYRRDGRQNQIPGTIFLQSCGCSMFGVDGNGGTGSVLSALQLPTSSLDLSRSCTPVNKCCSSYSAHIVHATTPR